MSQNENQTNLGYFRYKGYNGNAELQHSQIFNNLQFQVQENLKGKYRILPKTLQSSELTLINYKWSLCSSYSSSSPLSLSSSSSRISSLFLILRCLISQLHCLTWVRATHPAVQGCRSLKQRTRSSPLSSTNLKDFLFISLSSLSKATNTQSTSRLFVLSICIPSHPLMLGIMRTLLERLHIRCSDIFSAAS